MVNQHLISIAAENVLNQIEKNLKDSNEKQLSDEHLLMLHSVYGIVLEKALDVLEKYSILEVYSTADKSKSLIEVKGDNDRIYRIFPKVNFCPCRSFKYLVLEQNVQITCKHLLASRIALILNKTVDCEITQEQYLMLVKSIFEL